MLYYIDLCNENVGKVLYYDYQISFKCIIFLVFYVMCFCVVVAPSGGSTV